MPSSISLRNRTLQTPSAVYFWVCLLLGVWLVGDNLRRPMAGAAGVITLIPAALMFGVGFALLFLRRVDRAACLTALYLLTLGILARGNTPGLSSFSGFAPGTVHRLTTAFAPTHLLWAALLGALPLLIALLVAEDARGLPASTFRPLPTYILLACAAFVQTFSALAVLTHLSFLPPLDALARVSSSYHRLLVTSMPLILLEQGAALWLLRNHYRRWGEARNRALVRVFGAALLLVVASVLNDLLGSPLSWFPAYLLSYLVPLLLVYALERHGLFDVQITIRRVVQYALARQVLSVMLLAPLFALSFLMGLILKTENDLPPMLHPVRASLLADSRLISLICTILAGIFALMLALRLPLLRWFDRAYFREVYDAQRLLGEVGRSLIGLNDLQEIGRIALEGIDSVLHPISAMIFMEEEDGVACLARRNYTGYRPPLWPDPALLTADRVLDLSRPAAAPHSLASFWLAGLPETAQNLLDEADVRLIVPLHEGDRKPAALLLGKKASGLPYAPEDIEMLLALASQITLALQSARLNREFLQRRAQELQEGSVGFVDLVERERRLLAADLHDQTLPELRCLLTDLEALASAKEVPTTNAEAEPGAEKMAANLRQSIQNIRDIMESLRPSALEMLGLLPALENELRKSAARARPPLIPEFQVTTSELPKGLEEFAEMSVFRIVQEAINNACHHAGARSLRIWIGQEEGDWVVRVDDDGAGLPSETARGQGRGLDNMQYRANLIGGRLTWSVPEDWNRGTRVELCLPLS